jgi:hypothetical protein
MNASQQIDKQMAGFTDWRGRMMIRLRKIINDADPKLTRSSSGMRRWFALHGKDIRNKGERHE